MSEATVTTGGAERAGNAAALLSRAFAQDPTFTYLMASITEEERDQIRPQVFEAIIHYSATQKNAPVDEIGGWQSCGVMLPPKPAKKEPGPGQKTLRETLLEMMGPDAAQRAGEILRASRQARDEALGSERSYYVYFLGTEESARGKGLCSAVVRHYQDIARKEQTPIYLEAGTERAHRLYQKLGFVDTSELLVGQGHAAASGHLLEGGPGVVTWAMVWRP